MEGRVEDGDVGHVREGAPGGLDAREVGGVVQRREVERVADGVLDLGVDEGRLRELLAAMHDPVADGLDRREGVAGLSVRARRSCVAQPREHRLERGDVVGRGKRPLRGLARADAQAPERGHGPDALDLPRGERLARGGVEQVDLERRRAGVDDEDDHERAG